MHFLTLRILSLCYIYIEVHLFSTRDDTVFVPRDILQTGFSRSTWKAQWAPCQPCPNALAVGQTMGCPPHTAPTHIVARAVRRPPQIKAPPLRLTRLCERLFGARGESAPSPPARPLSASARSLFSRSAPCYLPSILSIWEPRATIARHQSTPILPQNGDCYLERRLQMAAFSTFVHECETLDHSFFFLELSVYWVCQLHGTAPSWSTKGIFQPRVLNNDLLEAAVWGWSRGLLRALWTHPTQQSPPTPVSTLIWLEQSLSLANQTDD